jgi:hypothetical protein
VYKKTIDMIGQMQAIAARIEHYWKLKYSCRYGTTRQKNDNYPVGSHYTHRKIQKPTEKI